MSLDKRAALQELREIKKELKALKEKKSSKNGLVTSRSRIKSDAKNFEVLSEKEMFNMIEPTEVEFFEDALNPSYEPEVEIFIAYAMEYTSFGETYNDAFDAIEDSPVMGLMSVDFDDPDEDGLRLSEVFDFSLKIPPTIYRPLSKEGVPSIFGFKTRAGTIMHVDLDKGYVSVVIGSDLEKAFEEAAAEQFIEAVEAYKEDY